ncbi:MAG: hypothetical protein JZU47_08150 [Prolixibacteraceae bacterium]|nr:hypothetical protein [Prolixibacteraceae bacterium]
MKIKRISVLLVALLISALLSNAQTNLVFYHDHEQLNSSNFNPAFLTSQQKFTFSIFPMSGMSVGYNNQEIIKDMLIQFLTGNQTQEDFQDVFKSLMKRDLFYQCLEFPILIFGHNTKWGSFRFQIKDVEQIMSDFKSDFSDFLSNPEFRTMSLNQKQAFPASAVYYREYSLGFGKEIIKDKLTVGIKAKLYFGKLNVTSDVDGGIEESSNRFLLKTYGSAKLSIPLDLVQNRDSILYGANMPEDFNAINYLFSSKNMGAGIDIGLNYQINPQLEFSASVIDLGRITWNNYVSTMNFRGVYRLPVQFIETSGPDYVIKTPEFSTEADNVNFAGLFKIVQDHNNYSTNLPTTFFTGLRYEVNPKFSVGLLNRYMSAKGLNQNSFSLTGHYIVNKKLSISSGYSIIGKSFTNMPLAILYKQESSQSFIGTDNFLSFLAPSTTEFSGITFGTCFYLFRKKNLYRSPTEDFPYYKPKKNKKVQAL